MSSVDRTAAAVIVTLLAFAADRRAAAAQLLLGARCLLLHGAPAASCRCAAQQSIDIACLRGAQ